MSSSVIDLDRHAIGDIDVRQSCRTRLDANGVVVLPGFFTAEAVASIAAENADREGDAYFANSSHNVYLTERDPGLPDGHAFNRQVQSSKGLIADDQIPSASPLRDVHGDEGFCSFLASVFGIEQVYPYADALSSINVHFAPAGRELGWHFDNSSFAVTMLLRAPEAGGVFEYVPEVRSADAGDMGFDRVAAVLDGSEPVSVLEFEPGDLVLFRGRNSLHRVTPTIGRITRMLVVFAFNDQPGIGLSDSALKTFYGRSAGDGTGP